MAADLMALGGDLPGDLQVALQGQGAAEEGGLDPAPDGDTIGAIRLPERCANVCFGGTRRNRLFMTASQSLYSVYVGVLGAGIA